MTTRLRAVRTVLLILAAGGVIGAGFLGVRALFFSASGATDLQTDSLLESVDASLSAGSLTAASDALASVRRLPRREPDQMRILKRALAVGAGSGDYSLSADLAVRALATGGGSARMRAVAAYAFLRSGRLAEAQKTLSPGGSAGPEGELLRGEVLLRRGAPWAGSDDLTREVLSLERSTDPDAYSRAAVRADDRRLSLDAALLCMERGDAAGAARRVRGALMDERFDEPAGLIFYDAGAGAEAEVRLRKAAAGRPQLPSIGFTLADIEAAGGNAAASEAWISRTLPMAPSLSWTPYADLAFFALGRGDMTEAARRVEDGLAFFPRSRELRMMKARVRARAGDAPGAQAILTALVAESPADSEAALILLSLQGPSLSPEASRARLWKLFNVVPADARVFDALASMLVAARDWDGMRVALDQHEAAGGAPDARVLVYQGFAAAMRGDDQLALSTLRRAALLRRDGVARFDLALVMLHRGAARAARTELEAAQAEIQETAAPPERAGLLSRVETLRAATLVLDGDPEAASSALSRARSLDPHNLRASLLLRKLEAGGQ